MNVNCKLTLTDEERNVMFRRITGKKGKALASRAMVCEWVKDQVETFIALGVTQSPEEAGVVHVTSTPVRIPFDSSQPIEDIDVEEVLKQNALLQSRVNVLQHRLDTK